MKKILVWMFTIWLFSTNAFAQEAKLFDETGNLSCEVFLANLDIFASEVNKADTNSVGYIISYEGKYQKSVYDKNRKFMKYQYVLPMFGESNERTYTMMNYIINFRGFPKEKLVFVNGGFRENYTVQFWVVPKLEKPPKIEPTLKNIKYRKGIPIDICSGIG